VQIPVFSYLHKFVDTDILRKYNPDLWGQSYGIGPATNFTVAQLNRAVPGSVASDLMSQAVELVQMLRTHPEVNFTHDWKMINIFYGGNDLCSYCYNQVRAEI
jgi:phospholipase B1